MSDADTTLELTEQIKPILAGHAPQVQSAALADLTAIWLAGFHVLDDKEATRTLRAELLARHCQLVRRLIEVNERSSPNATKLS